MEKPKNLQRTTWFLIVLFFMVTFVLFLGGHFYFQKQKESLRDEQFRFLSAINALKVSEISHWMEERKAEGLFIRSNSSLVRMFEGLLKAPRDLLLRREIEAWIKPIKYNYKYQGISFYDDQGNPVLEMCDHPCVTTPQQVLALTGRIETDTVVFTGMEKDTTTGARLLRFIVSLDRGERCIGYVIFRIDPDQYLSQLVSARITRETTVENLLLHMDGDSLAYLNEMPLRSNLRSSIHLVPSHDEVARSVPVSGTLAAVEAKDYRGVDVLAEVKKIPGTQWSLISKVDLSEIFAPLRKRAVSIILYLVVFLLVTFVTGLLIWKNQQLQHFRDQFELQRKNARAEERVRFMNALLEEVNDAIITFDKDLMIQSWNKGAEHIYGWTADEVVGKFGGGSLRVDFPGSTRETVFTELEKTGSWRGEVVHKRKNGTTAYLLSSTSQLKDENGSVLGIITINKDISAVVQSEKAKNAVYRISELAHATRDLEEMYAAIHVVIGELMDARNLYIALLSSDGCSISYPYFVDEKDPPPDPTPFGHGLTEYVMRSGKPLLAKPEDVQYYIEHGMIEVVGTPSIDWLGVPLKIDKETIGALVLQSYTSQIRYGEREKDILIFVSEQIALSIHRKKIQQELIEAKQKAEVSSKLTSSLLSNMNHELRTPMNGILGFAEILLNELHDPAAQVKAENILISGRRLMDTLDAIMDLSYLESDQISRKFKPVSVQKVVRNVFSGYDPLIRRKNLSVIQNIPPDAQILGDEHLFRHLIKNLVDNAVKYTETGSITIAVIPSDKNEQPFWAISITDTGIGISPENHRMIFEAFRQVSEGYGRQFEGSGLGLTLGKKIVTLMHGDISLSSVECEGSVFTVVLPAVAHKHSHRTKSRKELLEPALHPSSEKKMPDVLLVEDNLVNLQLLMVYIRDFCNVYSALDGQGAIDMTMNHHFDAILMDINLGPGMDGIQAMFEIRKRTEYKTVPIVAVTGYASIGDQDRLTSIGFNAYLPKPYDRDNIAVLMEELFPSR
jgi:PAS domain S-box-containing protein